MLYFWEHKHLPCLFLGRTGPEGAPGPSGPGGSDGARGLPGSAGPTGTWVSMQPYFFLQHIRASIIRVL